MTFEIQTTLDASRINPSPAWMRKFTEELGLTHILNTYCNITTNATVPELIKGVVEVVGESHNKTQTIDSDLILVFETIVVSLRNTNKPFEQRTRSMMMPLGGQMGTVKRVFDALTEKYPPSKKNSIDWWFTSDRKPDRTVIDLEHNYTPHDEFFPWIKPDIATFQKAFLESSANVLLLIGDPGTGKTSFVRNLIDQNDLSVAVTYDEELMMMDAFFVEFIKKPYDALIIEDADILLTSREGGNKVMNKLLNASDGLIQTKKKIIFTANLTDLSQVDEALIRPGRCFDALTFRRWTFEETKRAAQAAGLPEPDEAKTLAELFGKGPTTKTTPRIGFNLSGR